MRYVSLTERDSVEYAIRRSLPFEMRLDRLGYTCEDLLSLDIPAGLPVIATYRAEELLPEMADLLLCAARKGVEYVDVEVQWKGAESLVAAIHAAGSRVIVSYHNYAETPSDETLGEIYRRCVETGADIAKIVTFANTTYDAVRIFSLRDTVCGKVPAVTFAMGEKGRFTRLLSASEDDSVVFVAAPDGKCSASGQYTADEMETLLSPDGRICCRSFLAGAAGNPSSGIPSVRVPASKSYAIRYVLLSMLATGKWRLGNMDVCGDVASAISAVAELGGAVEKCDNGDIVLESCGLENLCGNRRSVTVHVGESGLLARAFMAIGALCGSDFTVCGEGSLCGRSFADEYASLTENGLDVSCADGFRLPFHIRGTACPGRIEVASGHSSQFLSGFVMALPFVSGKYELHTSQPPVSAGYVEMTRRTAERFADRASGYFEVEGDWSSASMLMAACAITGQEAEFLNLETGSLQPDAAIAGILEQCGVRVVYTDSGVKVVPGKTLAAFEYDAVSSPDLFPALVVLAMFCEGTSCIKGTGRLLNKESNRLESLYCEFRKTGLVMGVDGDVLYVRGKSFRRGETHVLSAHNDHRMAMAILAASLAYDGELFVDDVDCIGKSYPGFVADLAKFTGRIL